MIVESTQRFAVVAMYNFLSTLEICSFQQTLMFIKRHVDVRGLKTAVVSRPRVVDIVKCP